MLLRGSKFIKYIIKVMILTWRAGLNAGQYQRQRHLLQQRERSRGNLAQGPAGILKRITCNFISTAAAVCGTNPGRPTSTHIVTTHFVRCAFMLRYPLGVLAALSGRQLGHPDLTIASTHGQGGVSAVRQELCLYALEQNHFKL